MRKRLCVPVTLIATCSIGLLSACGQDPAERVSDEVGIMGNAEPTESPKSTDPDGEVLDFDPIEDIDYTDGVVGIRAADTFMHGEIDAFRTGGAQETQVDPDAADITAAEGVFAIPHPNQNHVELLDTTSSEKPSTIVPVDDQVTVAAPLTPDGIIAGSDELERVWVYAGDGTEVDTFKVARPSDYLLAHSPKDGPERVVRVNRFDTTIQDLQLDKARQGGTLRVGLGVGKVAFGEDGIVLAADTTGDSLLVYTTDEVIRLHQMAPTAPSPWAVAWDAKRKLAWVTSTATNTVTGYDISQGVPLERRSFDTVADARSLVALDDGTLILGSATGGGLQIIDPDADSDSGSETGAETGAETEE